jgi:hypothetical protein
MKRVIKHELVEVLIPANSTATRFLLPDLQNLRNTNLFGVQMYYDKIVPVSILSGRAVINKAVFQKSFLTLENYGGRQFLKQSPISLFQTIENNLADTAAGSDDSSIQEKDFKNFVGQKTNYPKSYIDLVTPSASLKDEVFLFSIYYTDKNENMSQTTFDNKR